MQQYARAKITRKIKGTALANFTRTCCVVWGDAMIINKYPDNLADHTEDDVGSTPTFIALTFYSYHLYNLKTNYNNHIGFGLNVL